MLSQKIFENLHTVVAILALFEQFLGKFCLNFLPLYLSVLPIMMHFVRTCSITRAEGMRIVIEKVRNYGKTAFIKNMFENGWWGGCIPTSLLDRPLPAQITISLTTTPTSRFGFSMMCGKFCHSCFEITARTALSQFGHFTLKTRVRFEKGGGSTPLTPPGCATVSLSPC